MDDIDFHLEIESRDITLCHWCRHSSVESSLPSILLPRVRLPSTPSFINYSQICLSFRCEKRTKINKKGAGLRPFLKYIAIAAFWCEELPFSTHQSRGKRFQKMKKILRCRWGECLPQPIRCFWSRANPFRHLASPAHLLLLLPFARWALIVIVVVVVNQFFRLLSFEQQQRLSQFWATSKVLVFMLSIKIWYYLGADWSSGDQVKNVYKSKFEPSTSSSSAAARANDVERTEFRWKK